MKNNDEMFQSVISRLDLYLEQKEKKKLYIRRFAPVIASLCFAFVICFAVWDGKKPDPLPEIDNMIVTETTSANTTALPQITEKNITSITEAATTALNVSSDTTVSFVNTTQTSVSTNEFVYPQTQVSSNVTQENSDSQSQIVSIVTTESVHSNPDITSAFITQTSTINTTIRTTVNTTNRTTIRTTIETTVRTTVAFTTTILKTTEYSGGAGNELSGEEQWAQLPINQRYYNAYIYGYDDVYVNGYRIPSDIVGDLIGSAEMHSQKRIDGKIKKCEANAYFINDYSDDIVVAIKFEDSDQYYLYCNQYSDIYEIRKIIPPQQ